MTRLLLIAASGIDWAGFDAKTRSGELPALTALRARGAAGWLGGAPITAGPAGWASMATGLPPEVHGVWRNVEAWPGGVRPVGQASWRHPPVWARVEAAGVSTGSVDWRASRPGAAWPGVHVDESYAEPTGPRAADWAMPRRCTPDALRAVLRPRRVHPLDVTAAMLAPLVPDLPRLDQTRDNGLPAIAIAMARAATVQSAAVWMLHEREEGAPDAVFIHHSWLGRTRLGFESRGEGHFENVIPGAWRFLDGLLGRLVGLAGPDALILVISPGWRGAPGVVIAAGAGVTASGEPQGAGLLDIVPTVLARFGLKDDKLPGRPMSALRAPLSPRPAPRPAMAAAEKPDPLLVYSVRKHGFRPPPRPGRRWKAQGLAELAYLLLDRDPVAARKLADAALKDDTRNVTALRVNARAALALEDTDALPALARALEDAAPQRGWGAVAQGAYHVLRGEIALAAPFLRRAENDPDPTTLLTIAAIWLSASRVASAERVFRTVLERDPRSVTAQIGLAIGAVARRDFMAAEQALRRALALDPGRPTIHLQLAQTYARSGRKAEAAGSAAMAMRLGVPRDLADAAAAGRLPG